MMKKKNLHLYYKNLISRRIDGTIWSVVDFTNFLMHRKHILTLRNITMSLDFSRVKSLYPTTHRTFTMRLTS